MKQKEYNLFLSILQKSKKEELEEEFMNHVEVLLNHETRTEFQTYIFSPGKFWQKVEEEQWNLLNIIERRAVLVQCLLGTGHLGAYLDEVYCFFFSEKKLNCNQTYLPKCDHNSEILKTHNHVSVKS